MASAEDITTLRGMLAEPIPPNGTEADTLFTDDQLGKIIDGAYGNLEKAAYEGWREKAGMYAGLVDVVDGAASRSLSQLQEQALGMVKVYGNASSGPTEGRTRIGKIQRPT